MLSPGAMARALNFGILIAAQLLPEMPGGGPAIGFSEQCYFYDTTGNCEGPPGKIHVLALDATATAATSSIPLGATPAIEAWQIHNAFAYQFPGYDHAGCLVEASYEAVVTALGPAAPP